MILFTVFVGFFGTAQANDEIVIGVLAKRGAEKCLKQWMPTAQYLTEKLGPHCQSHQVGQKCQAIGHQNLLSHFQLKGSSAFSWAR